MAHRGVLAFSSRRCQFHRHDNASFHGWVQSIDWQFVSVIAQPDALIQLNDMCRFEVYGERETATFSATLKSVSSFEKADSLSAPTGVAAYEVKRPLLEFGIVGPMIFAQSTQVPRKLANNHRASVCSPVEVDAIVHDVSDRGIALVTPHRFEPNETVELTIGYAGRELHLSGEIRYVQQESAEPNMYRSGVQIAELNRLEFGKWRQFVTDL